MSIYDEEEDICGYHGGISLRSKNLYVSYGNEKYIIGNNGRRYDNAWTLFKFINEHYRVTQIIRL